METAIQFTAALLITGSLALLARYRGYTRGYLDGLSDGRAETQQLSYHQGHEEGLYEGRLKERLEWETKAYKLTRDYEQGWADALEAVECETYTALRHEAETQLSA